MELIVKKCPYCAELIQDDAVKCRYCGEFLDKTFCPTDAGNTGKLHHTDKYGRKWYETPFTLILSFLAAGPFAIPLVWINKTHSLQKKIIITAVMVITTAILIILSIWAFKRISSYYSEINSLFSSGI